MKIKLLSLITLITKIEGMWMGRPAGPETRLPAGSGGNYQSGGYERMK